MGREVIRFLVLAALLLSGCAKRIHTSPPAHPNETHVLAETQRFARVLGIKVEGVITTKPYMVPAARPLYDGEKVPAAGRWVHGRIEFYRPMIQEQSQEQSSWLAAHEVAHAFYDDEHSDGKPAEARADMCAMHLMAEDPCPK